MCTDAAAMTSSYYSALSFNDGLVAELGLGDGPSDFDGLTQAGSLPVSPSSLVHRKQAVHFEALFSSFSEHIESNN